MIEPLIFEIFSRTCLLISEWSYLQQEGWRWQSFSYVEEMFSPALMGRSPARTTKTPSSRDLPFDLSILSVSFSNDLALQTFMPSLLFWAMIGCSWKLRTAQRDRCVSLTFMSPQPRQTPMNLLWCDPCEKTFHEDLSSNAFFLFSFFLPTHHPGLPGQNKGVWALSVLRLKKPMCNYERAWSHASLWLCVHSEHCRSLEYRLIKGL